MARFRLEIWKIKGLRRGVKRRTCPLCREEENDIATGIYVSAKMEKKTSEHKVVKC